ncbi:hypothetical protein M514_25394 [Trichuris suis]|uniref:Uncharacterized protein n=1 Tax=Trichuris suis TaxID=68888 RepID=A0A085MYU0_9BILA|nr:hypothetical protein M514_25394 [Trichuris suis]
MNSVYVPDHCGRQYLAMSWRSFSRGSPPDANLFLHMNSQRCSGSEVRWVPQLSLFPRLAWDHSDSMDCA